MLLTRSSSGSRDRKIEQLLLLIAEARARLQLDLGLPAPPPGTPAEAHGQQYSGRRNAQRHRTTAGQAQPEQPVISLGQRRGGEDTGYADGYGVVDGAGNVTRVARVLARVGVARVVNRHVVPALHHSVTGFQRYRVAHRVACKVEKRERGMQLCSEIARASAVGELV